MRGPDLVTAISRRTSLPVEQAKPMLEIFLETVREALRDKRRAELRGFGAFAVRYRGSAFRRNPRTGERVLVGRRQKVVFRPSQLFVRRLNGEHSSR